MQIGAGTFVCLLFLLRLSDSFFATTYITDLAEKVPLLRPFVQSAAFTEVDRIDPYFLYLNTVIEQVIPKRQVKQIRVREDSATQKTFEIMPFSGQLQQVVVTFSGGMYQAKQVVR